MKKFLTIAAAGAVTILCAQVDFRGHVSGTAEPAIAIPALRGSGAAQNFMGVFNQTLRTDVDSAGIFKMVATTSMPLFTPQQPSDFVTPPPAPEPSRRPKRGEIARAPDGGGHWLQDWSGPPTSADYLAFGYTADQNNVLVLRGWLYFLQNGNANPQVLAKTYVGPLDENGARKVAHEFAADIIAALGGKSMFGTHIYYVHSESKRSGVKEIWRMDPDGRNQQQLTRYNNLSMEPSVSPDGTKFAFTSY